MKAHSPIGALTSRAIEALEARGLDSELAVRMGLESASSPDGGDDWIAIPYVRGGLVLSRKYRRVNKIAHRNNFIQDKGGAPCWWNYDAITDRTLASQPLVVTEGEFDALAAIQAGFVRTVSVPNGAPERETDDHDRRFKFVVESLPDLRGIDRIVLATDNDANGVVLLNELALRLGKARCRYVRYPHGCKDLNDVLRQHGASGVARVLNEAEWLKVSGYFAMSELPPVAESEALSCGIAGLHEHYNLRRGDFCVITGIPGMGKSTFVNDLACRMVERHRWRVCFASFEQHPQVDHRRALRTWFNRKPERVQSPGELDAADDWIDQNFRFVVPDEDEDCDLGWLLETLAAAVIRFGVDLIVIDPWNELDHARPKDQSLTEYIGSAIRQLKRFASKWNVHLIVVAHPTKLSRGSEGKLPMPSLYDISDSSHWFNKPEVGIVVHRDETGTLIRVCKSRYHDRIGKPGTVTLSFNSYTNRFEAA